MSDFPVLDSSRHMSEGRVVLDELGHIEPYVDEMDWWCRMPLRVAHTTASDVVIEIGPYTLDSEDIERLRAALRSHDIANNGPGQRL